MLLVKLALLTVLWAACFSPSHRTAVDATTSGEHFGLTSSTEREKKGD